MSRRTVLKAGAATGLALALRPAVASAQDAAVDKAVAWAKANLPASTPEIVTGAAREGKLVLTLQAYGDDVKTRAMIAGFNKRYPFIAVTYTLGSGLEIVNRFSAELNAKRGISDYVHLQSNLAETNKFITSGGVAEFVVSQDAAFPEGTKQKGFWYPWLRQQGVTAYRAGSLSEDEKRLVRTYEGLADPRFKGRIGIIVVTSSNGTTGSYLLMNGGHPELWTGLVANKPRVKPSAAPLLDGLLAGEYDVAVMGAYPTSAVSAKSGAGVEFGVSSPSPVVYAPGVISALASNPNAAKLWQDWAMSKEGQDLWVDLIGAPSARLDAAKPWAEQQPWFFQTPSTNQTVDWDDFGKKVPEVMERYRKDLQNG